MIQAFSRNLIATLRSINPGIAARDGEKQVSPTPSKLLQEGILPNTEDSLSLLCSKDYISSLVSGSVNKVNTSERATTPLQSLLKIASMETRAAKEVEVN